MLDYISVIILGVSAIIPIVLDYIGIPDKYKKGLVITCMIALAISIVFSLKGVNDSQKKDKDLDDLTKRNLQIRDSVVIITQNTKRLQANLIETLELLEEFEGKSSSSNSTIRKRLSRSAKDLRDIIEQSHSLASTSTETQKLLAQVINYQHLDSFYSAKRAKQDSIETIKANYFRTFITLEMADNKRADSLNWARLERQIKANGFRDSVRLSALLIKVNTLEKQQTRDSTYLKTLGQSIAELQNAYQNLTDTISTNYKRLQTQINNSPDDVKAIKTAIGNMNGNFARQQNILNQLSRQLTEALAKLQQKQNNKPVIPPRGGVVPDTLD